MGFMTDETFDPLPWTQPGNLHSWNKPTLFHAACCSSSYKSSASIGILKFLAQMILKGSWKLNVLSKAPSEQDDSPSCPRAVNLPETTVLWSPVEKNPSEALVGNLKSTPCSERNYEEPVYLPTPYSTMLISSAFNRSIFTPLFLLWKSQSKVFLTVSPSSIVQKA